MSYCRWGWDGSDVYVYESDQGYECCGCKMADASVFDTPKDILVHLIDHRLKGDFVPDYAISGLWYDLDHDAKPGRRQPKDFDEPAKFMENCRENIWVALFKQTGELLPEGEAILRRFIKFFEITKRHQIDREAVDIAESLK